MEKILYLSRFLPYPPNSGGKKVSLYTLEILADRYIIDLVCFKDPSFREENIKNLNKFLKSLDTIKLIKFKRSPKYLIPYFNLTKKSYYFFRDDYTEYIKTVLNLLQKNKYKFVFIDEIFGSLVLLDNVIREVIKEQGLKIFMQVHNIESILIQRYLKNKFYLSFFLALEKKFAEKWEQKLWQLVDKTIFISQKDYNYAKNLIKDNREAFNFFFPSNAIKLSNKIDLSYTSYNILHIGTGHWPPNVEGLEFFLKKVFPLIKEQEVNAKFIHIGKGIPNFLKKLGNEKDIYIYDYIEDIEPFYEKANVFVVPLLTGSGIKIKILDAMCKGLPIITTPIGIEGIPFTDGIIVCKNANEMAKKIVELLKDKNKRMELGNKSYESALKIKKNFPKEELFKILGENIEE